MNQSDDISALAKALIGFQSALPAIAKDAKVETGRFTYRFLSMGALWEQIQPHLAKHGLAITQPTRMAEGGVCIETTVMHESGQWLRGQLFLPAAGDNRGSMAQAYGAAITYGRRYGLSALLGIVTEDDDDGASAGDRPQPDLDKQYTGGEKRWRKLYNVMKDSPDLQEYVRMNWQREMGDIPMPKLMHMSEERLDIVERWIAAAQDIPWEREVSRNGG